MAFLPRSFISSDPTTSFTPLFRLLDDFDQYSRGGAPTHQHASTQHLKTFSPKFDVKEVADAYELHGELPGIEQTDIDIEFTDAHTLVVKGHTDHSYTRGTPPAGFIEGEASSSTAGAIENGNVKNKAHQPRVEDESSENSKNAKQVVTTKTQQQNAQMSQSESQQPHGRFWVSERSVGHFSRSFSFPVKVDQDSVKASMRNGILSIVVPKAKKVEAKKITIC